jgi:hypothetical protein
MLHVPGLHQIRNPKAEIQKKSEFRIPIHHDFAIPLFAADPNRRRQKHPEEELLQSFPESRRQQRRSAD